MNLLNTVWHDLHVGDEQVIPTAFVADVIDGRVDSRPLDQLEPKDHWESEWLGQVRQRLTGRWGRKLRFSSYDDLAERLPSLLLEIVYCQSDLKGDYTDLNLIRRYIAELGIKSNQSVLSYLSGSGLCMHIASLGVAIARANGFQAEVVGHRHYYLGECGHHYGIRLTANDGRSKLLIPRGKQWWKFIKNLQFVVISDT